MNALEARALAMRIAKRGSDAKSEERNPQQERDDFKSVEIHGALPIDLTRHPASLAGRIKRQSKRK
jgi:hypothetical protein